jgi:acetyl/propionyl-CoA carboxylase alpha subunit
MKLSVWGADRAQAVTRLRSALDELRILGVQNNQGLFWAIARDGDFIKGEYGTPYLAKRGAELRAAYDAELARLMPALAIGAVETARRPPAGEEATAGAAMRPWEYVGLRDQLRNQ